MNGASGGATMNELGLTRICCRRMLLTHVDVIEDMIDYSSTNYVMDECNTTMSCLVEHERVVSPN